MTRHPALLAAVAVPLVAASAATLAPAAVISLTPVKDAYVDSENPSTNYGSDPTLQVRTGNSAGDTSRVTFVSFDLSGLTNVTAAELTVQKISGRGDRDTEIFGITDDGFDAYGETTITYGNASVIPPGAGGDTTSLLSETRLARLTSTTPARNDGVDVYASDDNDGDATNEFVDFINADANGIVTLAFHSSQQNGNVFTFASRENATDGFIAPTLTVTATPVPEPTTLAGVAALGGLVLRRRR